jgi:hypothetical protein
MSTDSGDGQCYYRARNIQEAGGMKDLKEEAMRTHMIHT